MLITRKCESCNEDFSFHDFDGFNPRVCRPSCPSRITKQKRREEIAELKARYAPASKPFVLPPYIPSIITPKSSPNPQRLTCFQCNRKIQGKPLWKKPKKKKKKKKIAYCYECFHRGSKKNKAVTNRLKSITANKRDVDFYKDGRWRILRYEVLLERGRKCDACGRSKDKHGVVLHVDHIKPRHLFPHLELTKSNLQLLCEDCNIGKGAWDQTDWR